MNNLHGEKQFKHTVSHLKYVQIILGFQTVLFMLYLFTISITYAPKLYATGDVLSRVTFADKVLIVFIAFGLLRNGYRWIVPRTFWAFLFYITTFLLASFFAHYYGYVMPGREGSWKGELAAHLFVAGGLLAIFDYLIALSPSFRLRLLQVFVIASTIWALIGFWDMATINYQLPRISHYAAWLSFTASEELALGKGAIFIAAFRNQQQAAFFYFVVAIAAIVNMVLLSNRKSKLFFGSIIWIPWSAVILTCDRSDSIGLIFGTFLLFVFALIERKFLRTKIILICWIGIMTFIMVGLFSYISPRFNEYLIGKTIGRRVTTIKKVIVPQVENVPIRDPANNITEERRPVVSDQERRPVVSDQERRPVVSDQERRPVVSDQEHTVTIVETTTKGGIQSKLYKERFLYDNTIGVWNAFLQHPLGHGFAGYGIIGKKGTTVYDIEPHGVYPKIFSEGGIFAIPGLIYLFWSMLREPFRHKKNCPNTVKIMYVFVPLLLGMFITFFYIYGLRKRELWLLMAFILALTSNRDDDNIRKSEQLKDE